MKACYALEGDGPLVLSCYEIINVIVSTIQANHTSALSAVVSQVCAGTLAAGQQLMQYAKSYVQEGLDYFQDQLATTLRDPLSISKAVRLFSPQCNETRHICC